MLRKRVYRIDSPNTFMSRALIHRLAIIPSCLMFMVYFRVKFYSLMRSTVHLWTRHFTENSTSMQGGLLQAPFGIWCPCRRVKLYRSLKNRDFLATYTSRRLGVPSIGAPHRLFPHGIGSHLLWAMIKRLNLLKQASIRSASQNWLNS